MHDYYKQLLPAATENDSVTIHRTGFGQLFNLLTSPELFDTLEELLPEHRERVFPPAETLSLFLAQAMQPDRSCQRIVNESALTRVAQGLKPCSIHTGGYCLARQRLPIDLVSTLARTTGN